MIRSTTKYALELLGFVLGGLMVLSAVLAWRLSAGPVPAGFLAGVIEDLANKNLSEGTLEISHTSLDWSSERQVVFLHIEETVLRDGMGAPVLTIPKVSIDFRLRSLLTGTIRLEEVELTGVSVQVFRRKESGIEISLADQPVDEVGDTPAVFMLAPLLQGLMGTGEKNAPFTYLRRLAINEADIAVIDEMNGVSWNAPRAEAVLFRDENGVSALLDAELATKGKPSRIILNGLIERDAERAEFNAEFDGLNPSAFAAVFPYPAFHGPLDLRFSGSGIITVDLRKGALAEVDLLLNAVPGKIMLPLISPEPVEVRKASLDISLDLSRQFLQLNQLVYEAGNNRASVTGSASFTRDGPVGLKSAEISLEARDVSLEIRDFIEGVLPLKALDLSVALDFDTLSARVEDLRFTTKDDGFIAFKGQVMDAPDSPSIEMTAQLHQIYVEDLSALWPIGLVPGARRWVMRNARKGLLNSGSLNMNIAAGQLADRNKGGKLPQDAVDFRFDFTGMTLSYLADLPLMREVQGRGHLTGNSFEARVESGKIVFSDDTLKIVEGRFFVPTLHVKGGPGEIFIVVDGPLPALLGYFDMEPFGFISGFGLDPLDFSGEARLRTRLDLPLKKDVRLNEVAYRGTATTRDAGLANVVGEIDLSAGALNVEVKRQGLSVNGPAQLNGVPVHLSWEQAFKKGAGPDSRILLRGNLSDDDRMALGLRLSDYITGIAGVDAQFFGNGKNIEGGTVDLDLTHAVLKQDHIGWRKPAGHEARGRFDLAIDQDKAFHLKDAYIKGENLSIEGNLVLSPGGDILEADVPRFVLDATSRGQFQATRSPSDNTLRLTVRGASFDARGVIDTLLSGVGTKNAGVTEKISQAGDIPGGVPEEEALEIEAQFERVRAHNNVEIRDVALSFRNAKGRTQALHFDGRLRNGGHVNVSINKRSRQSRRLVAHSDDAGTAFRALDLYSSLEGGKVDLQGQFNDETGELKGRLLGTDVRAVNEPLLAKLLTIGSLTGFADTLAGEGILFEQMNVPYHMVSGNLYFDGARMIGPALGLTIKGGVKTDAGIMDVNGTIAPAYTLNSLLTRLPIIGDILLGGQGEGIFALTYTIFGPQENPQILVNPLAALAPGFLRRLFEFGSSLEEDGTPKKPLLKPKGAPRDKPVLPEPGAPVPDAGAVP